MRIAYVHELEEKVNRLEAMLNSLGRRVEDHIQVSTIRILRGPSSPQKSSYLLCIGTRRLDACE
jgi:hypothetical protein